MSSKIKGLETQKRANKRSLDKLLLNIDNGFKNAPTERSVAQLHAAIDEFQNAVSNFHNLCLEIITEAEESGINNDKSAEDIEKAETATMASYDSYLLASRRLKGDFEIYAKKLSALESPRRSLLNSTATENAAQVKMPKIEVPKFDGDIRKYNDWVSLFENLVHLNEQLDPLKKLYYLKSALEGNAAQLLIDTPLTESAYTEAWAELKATYDNRRLIISAHFKDLIDLKPIRNEGEIRESLLKQKSIMRGLKICGIDPKEKGIAAISAYIVSSKLEPSILREWERSIKDNTNYPTLITLQEFLRTMQFSFETSAQSNIKRIDCKNEKSLIEKDNTEKAKKKSFVTNTSTSSHPSVKCVFCNGNHFGAFCEKFLSKSITDRFTMAKEARLCTNCLKPNHKTSECRAQKCKVCNKPHNTVLHRTENETETKSREDKPKDDKVKDDPKVSKSTYTTFRQSVVSLLPSAVVHVVLNSKLIKARALLDNCSQPNLMSETFAQKHRIPLQSSCTSVGGITSHNLNSNFSGRVCVKSRINKFQLSFDVDIVPRIPYTVNKKSLSSLTKTIQGIQFADTDLDSDEVDLIIGCDFVNIILLGQKAFVDHTCFEKSQFGWIISGPLKPIEDTSTKHCYLVADIDRQLRTFWEVEDVECNSPILSEHDMCVKHFEDNVNQLSNGQFVVSLPFNKNRDLVANTYRNALAALKRSENNQSKVREMYKDFMREYLTLGHMEKVPSYLYQQSPVYFLPHHAVLRPSSLSTKLRVVFNASAKNTTGLSLNDILMTGPTIQPDLCDLLISFRKYPIAFCADITKMYRCVLINENDRDMQRILWRENPNDPIEQYRLTTVTYGTSSASFLATKCLEKIAKSIEDIEPEAANAIKSEFYMDDLMSGAETYDLALMKQRAIHDALASAGMNLTKYASNSSKLIDQLNPQLVAPLSTKTFELPETISTLGLQWQPLQDVIGINVQLPTLGEASLTKCQFLSLISRIFDPLGIISPVTITAKILMQDLWREGIDWKENVPTPLENLFRAYYDNLPQLSKFTIPRAYCNYANSSRKLIGFCDASAKAYCAVVYLKSIVPNKNNSVIICAKTRVAPIKSLTIPRLELLSAVMLTKLLSRIRKILKIDIENIYAFSDSTIVLSWLASQDSKLGVFIQNRISLIASQLPISQWGYVNTLDNPADLGTRGITVNSLLSTHYKKWVYGPSWLENDFCDRIKRSFLINSSNIHVESLSDYFNRFSSYLKLLHVTAYIRRFYLNCKCISSNRNLNSLSVEEIEVSRNNLIKLSQIIYFSSDIDTLQNQKPLNTRSKLLSLNPFLDKNGILRINSRIANSNFSYDTKFPIILHNKCRFLKLFVNHVHVSFFHAKKNFVINYVRSRFWIVGGIRNLVKNVIFNCVHCTKITGRRSNQLMGNLPTERTTISRPFSNVGVDFAGPFKVKCTGYRSVKLNNIYAAFFVCFSVKAVHIEIVPDLTTDSLISALDRFCARRGVPKNIYSDNATNFVGANNAISQTHIVENAASRSITWHFIPPRSPHFGGLWEAAIKSGKSLFKNAIGQQTLNYDQFTTIFARIEAILNSRPLCKIRTGDDFEPLTPAHFLIGTSLFDVPLNEEHPINLTRRYQFLRNIIQSFWRNWSQSYLNQLHTRSKWKVPQSNFEVGDIVLLRKANAPVLEWPLAKIIEVYPDQNNFVRSVKLRTQNGEFSRAIVDLIRLPTETESQ